MNIEYGLVLHIMFTYAKRMCEIFQTRLFNEIKPFFIM